MTARPRLSFILTIATTCGLALLLLARAWDSPVWPIAIGILIVTGLAALTAMGWRMDTTIGELTARLRSIETVLAHHPTLTLVLTPTGHPLAAYGAAPLPLPMEGLFEKGLIEAVHAPDRPAVQTALSQALRGQQVEHGFTPRLALDLRLSLTVRPLTSSESQDDRLIAVIQDASLQHAREEALRAARAEAEAQSLGKTRMLANVSHELRTPLNAVIGFSDIMVQGLFGSLPGRYRDYARSIHEAGSHLLDMISDLLDLSKIEAQRYDLTVESFDAREPLASAMALMRIASEEKGIKLAAVLPTDPVRVRADRRALKQISLNLLSNAVKFTPTGGTVTLAASSDGPELELVVADTGLGISPGDLARLGRPFEQAGDMEDRAQGTGLGLSLVQALSQRHGGQMTIESAQGVGTAVTIRLPIMMQEDPAKAAPPEAEVIPLSLVRHKL